MVVAFVCTTVGVPLTAPSTHGTDSGASIPDALALPPVMSPMDRRNVGVVKAMYGSSCRFGSAKSCQNAVGKASPETVTLKRWAFGSHVTVAVALAGSERAEGDGRQDAATARSPAVVVHRPDPPLPPTCPGTVWQGEAVGLSP